MMAFSGSGVLPEGSNFVCRSPAPSATQNVALAKRGSLRMRVLSRADSIADRHSSALE